MSEHYELIRMLGQGGFGQVYLARFLGEAGFQKEVALKFLNTSTSSDRRLLASLRDEARLLGLLRHRNIVHVDRLIQLRGAWVIVMEYVPGVDLMSLIRRGALPAGVVMEIVSEVAAALTAAIERHGPDGTPLNLSHCDIKPNNIRITRFGEVKVLDFGIAHAEFVGREGGDSEISGTPHYMSPERFRGSVNPAVDVYALGILAFEAMTATRLPLIDMDESSHAGRIEHARTVLERAHVDPEVCRLILEMLSFRADDRPAPATVRHRARRLALTREIDLASWLDIQGDLSQQDGPSSDSLGLTLVLGASQEGGMTTGHLAKRRGPETIEESSDQSVRLPGLAFAMETVITDGTDAPRVGTEPSLERPVLPSSQPTMAGKAGGIGVLLVALVAALAMVFLAAMPDPEPQPALIPASTEVPRADEELPFDEREPTVSKSDDGDPSVPEEVPASKPEAAARPRVQTTPSTRPTSKPARPGAATPATRAPRSPHNPWKPPERRVRIEVSGDASRVKLQGDAGAFVVPGNVVPGTYTIWATFPGEESAQRGSMTVEDGGVVRVNCDSMFRTCVKR